MAKRDSLGDRMKEFYEFRAKTKLVRRMPCIIRLDGRSFHTFTKGFVKPFDKSVLGDIEKAIFEANIGLTPNNNGEAIFLVILVYQ